MKLKKKFIYRIVIDANILVSSFLDSGGYPDQSIEIASENIICINDKIKSEYLLLPEKLKKKKINFNYNLFMDGIKMFLKACREYPQINKISICRDPKDNCYLNVCLTAKADFLITGDRDLLSITKKQLKRIGLSKLKILLPKEFSDLLNL